MNENMHSNSIMWVIVILGIITIVGLGIFAASGLNYSFPDLTTLLPL